MPKAPTDYARLADEAELLLDGITARVNRSAKEITRLLGDHPQREAIMQAFNRYATNVANQTEIQARHQRYVELRDAMRDADGKIIKS